jgi:hypothetical protein
MGVLGMHERARRIGARLSVGDRPEGSGTVVELMLDPAIALRRARASSRGKAPEEARIVTDSQVSDQAAPRAETVTAEADSSRGRLLRRPAAEWEVNRGR